jgi:hypothetical protein
MIPSAYRPLATWAHIAPKPIATDGSYTMTVTQHEDDNVNILEFKPGEPAIERYTWKNIDQLWVRKIFKK